MPIQNLILSCHAKSGENVNIQLRDEKNEKDVHMDSMAFGMGCCCLQVTMQATSDRQSRFLHDQLAVLSPLLLALSASTPIHKGVLTNVDVRWGVISQSVDDRTCAERGDGKFVADSYMAGQGVQILQKSRYSSVSLFIGKPVSDSETKAFSTLNDIGAEVNQEAKSYLVANGVDEQLANHIAHIFTRDPLVIFNDSIVMDDTAAMDHFENIQSTNWRTMRWKPPMLGADKTGGPGWRVEFRPLEVQLTDFENAAYAIFVILLSRSLLAMGHNFYMPMSLVEENMNRAIKKDAVLTEKFWMNRKSLGAHPSVDFEKDILATEICRDDLVEMTANDIMNGCSNFCGIIPSITWYLEALGCDTAMMEQILPYLDLLRKRASGELPTTAKWIRNFVKSHSKRSDGVDLNSEVADKLMQTCEDIGMGRINTMGLNGLRVADRVRNMEESTGCFSESNGAHIYLGGLPGSAKVASVCSESMKTHSSQSVCEG